MRVLLINSNREIYPWPVVPLGLSYIASTLKAHHHSVKFLDLCFPRKPHQVLRETLTEFQPEAIGISIRNIDNVNMCQPHFYLPEIKEKIVDVCFSYSKAPVIIGGSAIGMTPEMIMDYFHVDYAVAGDGEEAMVRWLQFLESEEDEIPAIRGLFQRQSDGVIKPPEHRNLNAFTSFERPRPFQWIDHHYYEKNGASINIQSKRGCVFKCIYCSYNLIEGNQYRLREPGAVVDEIEEWIAVAKPRSFDFVDSTFNSPQSHAIDICEELIRRDIKWSFTTMGLNPGCISPELLEVMKAAGFEQCMCSPDSASPVLLHNLCKNFTLQELVKAAQLFKRFNLRVFWFFILGGPGETAETVKETLDFCKTYIPPEDVVHFTIGFRVFPETRLAEIMIEENHQLKNSDLFRPSFYCSNLITPDEILAMIHQAARQNLNFISYFDMDIYDGLKYITLLLNQRNPPDHNWTNVPNVNRNLKKIGLWNLIHKYHRTKFHRSKIIPVNVRG
ncbi:B12-binding domain-containing radical SAM protein [candidate division CSSED10-310 bacterium]|uniref:B12-binding domain-containing radical SAM protein n=1 Tax=candidate division CSSED10-310 bacterium TaxID=2855610 RepID=A0ABV6YVC2_UNCC1